MSKATGTREFIAAQVDGKPLYTTGADGQRHLHTIDVTDGVEPVPCSCGEFHA